VHGGQRAKLERFGDELFVVAKPVHFLDDASDDVISTGDLLVFVGCRYVVTVRHGGDIGITKLRKDMQADGARLKDGPGEVLHALLDLVADGYGAALDELDEQLVRVQEQVFDRADGEHSKRIFFLKKEVLEFRLAVSRLEEPLSELASATLPAIAPDLRPYFRDVHDHVVRVMDRLSADDVLLSSTLDANIAQIGMQQNEDMRKMSAWLAIGAVPTLIGAIYGMNFQHMPELGWKYGYPLVLLVIAAACTALYLNFKSRDWL
jgi:magnesium transporter